VLAELMALLKDLQFWASLGAAIIVWWLLGALIARLLYGLSQDPLAAARGAAHWSFWITAGLAAAYGWFRWHDALQAAILASGTLIVLFFLTLVLLRFEPRSSSA